MARPIEHYRTVTKHRKLVRQHCFRCGLYLQGILHDLSKYSPAEFLPGARYYQGNRSPNTAQREIEGCSTAWLHHKGRNRHHMEYWFDLELESRQFMNGLCMPRKYVAEMVCDRIAACKTYYGKNYTQDLPLQFYEKTKKLHLLWPPTAEALEKCLTLLKDEGEDALFYYIRNDYLKKDKEKA